MPSIRRTATWLAAAALLAAASGCSAAGPARSAAAGGAPLVVDSAGQSSPFDGILLGRPFAKPDFTLTDNAGHSYNFAQETSGRVTLLYFGYTHCPDVCPTTMAGLAAALRALPAAERSKISVVFVSTDPTRDTPAVLNAWLGQFNPAFIGLTGAFGTIQKAASSLGITIEPPVKESDGNYTITHGAEVLAFDSRNKAWLVWTAGTTVAQYDHDLPLILAGQDVKDGEASDG
jgi:protein SCO1/2